MKLVAVFALCTLFVVGDLLTLTQFTDEVLQIAALHNYDAIFVDLDETLCDALPKNPIIPASIFQSSCAPVSRERILYFVELPTNSSNARSSLSSCSQGIMVLFYRNSSFVTEAIHRSTILLRKLKISKAIQVIYNPSTLRVQLIPYDFVRSSIDRVNVSNLINSNTPSNLHGYCYIVHCKKLYPYFCWKFINGKQQPLGLDVQLLKTIATHQNATVQFRPDPNKSKRCPPADPSVDLNIRRSACSTNPTDRLYLPQRDEACVIVPKRHQRLILLQLTKPFQLEVWILVVVYVLARFFLRFDRWRLLLLVVVLVEFWLTECYGAKVIEYMTTLRYAPSPKTMAELISRRERFVLLGPERDYLKTYSGIHVQVVTEDKERYIGRRALLYFCRSAEVFINSDLNYNPETNDRSSILLKERLGSYPSSYGCLRNHPLRAGLERYLRYVFESGVWRKIHDQFRQPDEQFMSFVAPGEYLIEFDDLMLVWTVCCIGWAVAVGVFAVETAGKKGFGF